MFILTHFETEFEKRAKVTLTGLE